VPDLGIDASPLDDSRTTFSTCWQFWQPGPRTSTTCMSVTPR
jgi:hypothetical protein